MPRLAIDRTKRVLRVTLSGLAGPEHLHAVDWAVIEVLAKNASIGAAIYDYSGVSAFAVSERRIIARAQMPAIVRGARIIVPSNASRGAIAAAFCRHQRDIGEKPPIVVPTLRQAYTFLDTRPTDFGSIDAH